jgi:hypothetical protein
MSDEQQEPLTGREGNEAAQGWTQMAPANPVSSPDDLPADAIFTEEQLAHAKRPATDDWGPEPIEREYRDVNTGEEIPPKFSVDQAQAASDLAKVRAEERQAREDQSNRDLADALDHLNAKDQGQQPPVQQDQQPQPETFEPQPQTTDPDPWAQADAQITEMLSNPVVRERIQGELTEIQTKAKAEVDGAWQQVEATKAGYIAHANALTGQLNALVLSNFPELQSVAGDPQRLAGAVELLKQTNPKRAAELQDFVLRASTVAGQLEQQGQAHRQAQAAQHEEALTQYTNNEIKRYEAWTAREVGDVRAVRENLQPILQKAYGIDANQLKAIHDGKVQIDGARLLRSAEFQAVLTDAIRFRIATQGVRNAVARPVQKVMRPGVSESGPSDNSEYASLERSFRGKDLSAKQAADLLIAHRARR